jgi:osmotically-inducible protein OsmY
MKNAKAIVGSLAACGLFLGCSDYNNGDQISTAQNESRESPNFGSATDVTPSNGRTVTTNDLNAADNGIGGAPQRASGNFQSQPLPGQSSDVELAKQIKVALTTGSMGTTGAIAEDQLTRIDVQVRDGVAFLSGPVASEQEKRTIEKQVAGMKGVKGVRSKLTVGSRQVEDKALEPLVPRTTGNE